MRRDPAVEGTHPPQPIRLGRVLIEGTVIVSSILLALGAEAWWQERTDRSEERLLLSALHDEFQSNASAFRSQADSISAAMLTLQSIVTMSACELVEALETDRGSEISQAVQRPRTVEFRVGALDGTLGTGRASLIQSHELLAELAQYQAVRNELGEIGAFVGTVTVDAFVSLGAVPETHRQLIALLKAKIGYWDAYRRYLERFIAQTERIAQLLADEIA